MSEWLIKSHQHASAVALASMNVQLELLQKAMVSM